MNITSKLPEIRINFSRLLYNGEYRRLDLILNNGESKMASAEKYEARADEYRKAWAQYEEIVLRGMTEVLALSFYRPVIDVTLAPYFRCMSVPLIINFRPDPDRFVLDVLKAPERLEREISSLTNSQTAGAHIQAWEYVNGQDYMEIVKGVRQLYQVSP